MKNPERILIKEKYGTNKRIHALPDVDEFYVNYDRKGLLLARGDDNSPYTSISLSWKKVANRISYLIKNDQFLQAEDYVHMSEYEREQMANKILSFLCSSSGRNRQTIYQ